MDIKNKIIIFSIYAHHSNINQIKEMFFKDKWNCDIYDDSIYYFNKYYTHNNCNINLRVNLYNELIPTNEIADIVFVDEELPDWVHNRYNDWSEEKELGEVMYARVHSDTIKKMIKDFPDYAELIFNYYNKEGY